MGAGAFAIRTNVKLKSSSDIIKHLVNGQVVELKSSELFSPDISKRFDTRYDNCFTIYKTEDYIFFENSNYTSKFFDPIDNAFIKQVFLEFNKPSQIFAFENYASGDTYGYSILNSGKIVRTYRYSNGVVKHFGEPLNIEKKWLELKISDLVDEDGEKYKGVINPDDKRIYHIDSLPNFLFNEVMLHEIGFLTEDISSKSIETRYFRI